MAKEVTPEQIQMLDEMVARAQKAADIIATYDQARVDRLCQAVAAAVCDMKVWANLADETGLGDKVTKRNKRNKIKLILRDCLRQKSVGVIEEIPEKGIVKYAKPVGVIASLWSETIARAALEIMACGRPLVSTSVGVMPDLLPAEALAAPGDVDALTALLRRAVVDAAWRGDLARTCSERIATLRDEDFLQQTLAVYAEACRRRRSSL